MRYWVSSAWSLKAMKCTSARSFAANKVPGPADAKKDLHARHLAESKHLLTSHRGGQLYQNQEALTLPVWGNIYSISFTYGIYIHVLGNKPHVSALSLPGSRAPRSSWPKSPAEAQLWDGSAGRASSLLPGAPDAAVASHEHVARRPQPQNRH